VKIIKHITHQSIDCLFKTAFGDDIQFVWMTTPFDLSKHDQRYAFCEPIFTSGIDNLDAYIDTKIEYDWVIIDNPTSMELAKRLKAKHYLFYIHSYKHDDALISDLIKLNDKTPIVAVAPSRHKKGTFKGYFPIASNDCKVIWPAVWDGIFEAKRGEPNGRILLITNNLHNRVEMYPESMEYINPLFAKYGDLIDVYGRNTDSSRSNGMIWKPYAKGLCKDICTLCNYQVAVFPLVHWSPAIAMFDCMAMGIPVVTTIREGFANEDGDGFYAASNPVDFCNYVGMLIKSDANQRGITAKIYAEAVYNTGYWCRDIKEFMRRYDENVC
jgi:hypothetical protein